MPTVVVAAPTGRVRLGRSFSLLWGGEGVSLLGAATTSVLLPLLAVTEFGAGPVWMGVLTAASWLPWLVIGLPAGAWLDRRDPRQVMIIADLVAAATLASVPIAWSLQVLSLTQLAVVAVLGGTCTVFFRTAYVKLLPRIVPDAGLEAANSRVLGTESAMQVVGPGVAALVAQLTSAAAGIIGSVVGFCVSAGCLARIRVDRAGQPSTAAEPLRTRIAEGVRLVVGDRYLRALMIIGGVSNFGLTGYAALLVLFLITELGLPESGVGIVLMVGSVGGLLGALIAPWLARRLGTGRASTLLLVAAGPSALLVGSAVDAGHAYLTATGLLLVGVGVVGGNVIRGSWRQRYVPAHLMGRVLATMQVVNYGTMPLAGVAAGILGSWLGVQPAIMVLAGVHAVACVSILGTSIGRCRELPVARSTPSDSVAISKGWG
ncbi:MAG TPA: MFS transporter [Microlunatus sp.]|nr:MFS transporter [Microlunatus sp.]